MCIILMSLSRYVQHVLRPKDVHILRNYRLGMQTDARAHLNELVSVCRQMNVHILINGCEHLFSASRSAAAHVGFSTPRDTRLAYQAGDSIQDN